MSEHPHTAIMRELLVRYLDVWTPAVLRSHRSATYIEAGNAEAAADAMRVFSEFADRLTGHHLDVILLGPNPTPKNLTEPPGLSLRSIEDPADLKVTGPALAHLDASDTLDEPTVWRLVKSLTPGKARELLLTLPPTTAEQVTNYRTRLSEAGLTYAVTVELTDNQEHTRLLLFATADNKHLTTFKNELWSADEFAGIRYRDPRDKEHTLIDISLKPQLLPLRRALLTELARRGTCTAADLQQHTLQETIYRPTDTIEVLTSAATAGSITRNPPKGRISPRTVITPRN
jgi:hypothetical protein